MTNILVAKRNGVITDPDGNKYRLIRGRTHADARHPAAVACPDAFMPFLVEMPYREDGELPPNPDGTLAEEYRVQLAAIVELLGAKGLLPSDDEMNTQGWLVRAIEAALPAVEEEPAGPDRATMRAWAAENGYTVSARGALPRDVVTAYLAAH